MAIGEPPPMPQACTGKPSASSGRQAFFLISEKFVLDLFSRLCLGRRHPGSPRAYSGETRGGAGSGSHDPERIRKRSWPPRWSAARARAPTSLGRGDTLARCSGVSLPASQTGRGQTRHGCGVPHQRPRGAPLPQDYPEGVILRCSSAQRSSREGRKARLETVTRRSRRRQSRQNDRRDGRSVGCMTS